MRQAVGLPQELTKPSVVVLPSLGLAAFGAGIATVTDAVGVKDRKIVGAIAAGIPMTWATQPFIKLTSEAEAEFQARRVKWVVGSTLLGAGIGYLADKAGMKEAYKVGAVSSGVPAAMYGLWLLYKE